MATFINKRINNTTNTKEDTSMENKIMYIQQTNSIATMLPGGGMHGGEQTDILPGGGFHNECTEELPGGGMHGGEQTDILPSCEIHVDLNASQETSDGVKTDEEPPWMTGGEFGVDWFFA